MKIRILYFASLREALGRSEERFEVPAGIATLGALRLHLASRDAAWATALGTGRNVRCARNQQMSGPDGGLADGDEIAFFPPVTGG